MTMKRTILVYTTQYLPREHEAALLHRLNHPTGQDNRQNQYHFDLANVNAIGMPLDNIVSLHLEKSTVANSADATDSDIQGSLIIVADDGVLPASHPQTVLIVKVLDGAEGRYTGEGAGDRFQSIRVLSSSTAFILSTIASGQHGWEDYWKVAQANGGHFPGE
ncbi:hypothetical protein D9615_007653 [Tricholomella constricta]|uniref:Uncharacterized protein n=1 Tax=Tricholomella constricta TaxID=117010 RepID=A0A8H5M0H6_9AGAR|nr:hypothetical protein D9615_007653 [Tricholomella constricta]